MKCKMCSGPLMFLGQMGRLSWHQCRNCGMNFSREDRRRESKDRREERRKEKVQ